MSHFYALAFVPQAVALQGPEAVRGHVDRVMALYAASLLGESADTLWDSWEVGGRYDGNLARYAPEPGGAMGTAFAGDLALQRNARVVGDLSFDLVPFAIVTPDGQTHMEGQMAAFGVPVDTDAYWEDRVDELREAHAECVAVGLDCHI